MSFLAIADDQEAVCYLCLDAEPDEDDQPLRRDCACRGTDAGFVHLSCLTKYAATKSEQASFMNQFVDLWQECPGCHQYYQNEFAVDIANEFVSFVRRQYPDDTQKQVESLHLKLAALMNVFDRLQPRQKREYGVTANVILSLIDWMKGDVSSLPIRYSRFELNAYNAHGRIALNEGTEESARRAVIYFEKSLQVSEAISDDPGIATTKRNIALAKSKYEGDNTEVLKASQELFELRVAEFGEENDYTIDAGIEYAIFLLKANRGGDARELLTKLLVTSKRVLGPRHNTTKRVESELKKSC